MKDDLDWKKLTLANPLELLDGSMHQAKGQVYLV
jgi:hypothetical protein